MLKKFDANGEAIRGDRDIIPEEAKIICRIFQEFASGKSPKAIAKDLNREGVPGPHGRAWGDTSIRGHQTRGTGIINNELYTGALVWNRLRYIKDPSTGKRVSRINPESQWIRTKVAHLRIVGDELWAAARARQKQISEVFGPNPANTLEGRMKRVRLTGRPVHLLSGLLTCGCCGGKVGITTPNRYACLNHHRRGTCDNGRSITRDRIEARVLTGLKERLVSSEAVAEAVRAYAEEMNRLNRGRRIQATTDQKTLAKIEKAIAGIIAAIEDGMYQPSMKARMDDLERQKTEIVTRMAQAPADIPDIHPNIANLYRRRVEHFSDALNDPDGGRQAAEALRSLIGEIVLTPGEKRGEVHATLRGELFGILELVKGEERQRLDQVMSTANARPRNQFRHKSICQKRSLRRQTLLLRTTIWLLASRIAEIWAPGLLLRIKAWPVALRRSTCRLALRTSNSATPRLSLLRKVRSEGLRVTTGRTPSLRTTKAWSPRLTLRRKALLRPLIRSLALRHGIASIPGLPLWWTTGRTSIPWTRTRMERPQAQYLERLESYIELTPGNLAVSITINQGEEGIGRITLRTGICDLWTGVGVGRCSGPFLC